jgi:anhydro-N-acetylmuramic acid kinase
VKKAYNIIGVMSGTSLDGVDLAHCTFRLEDEAFAFKINECTTIEYGESWRNRLSFLPFQSAEEYARTHVEYGRYLGSLVKSFAIAAGLRTDAVASHGHTIFHDPANRYTSQIGEGAALASTCGIPVICDFRTTDVGYGGQGAPLVPLGDEQLFGEYAFCLNIGGFANISFEKEGKRIAFDICPANIVLNKLSAKTGQPFDRDGMTAASGKLSITLLERLNGLDYYQQLPPKSLGREWVEQHINPILEEYASLLPIEDLMHTFVEHIAIQIGRTTAPGKLLVTGGGAFHSHLINRLKVHSDSGIIIPGKEVIEFKEALIFAFLGLLRLLERPNALSSVTGAKKNSCGGAVYLP